MDPNQGGGFSLDFLQTANLSEIIEAVRRGNSNPASFLSRTPLENAIQQRNETEAKRLIANGADVNAKEVMFGFTPLHLAAAKGLAETTMALLTCRRLENANEKAEGFNNRTPLHQAIAFNNEAVAKILIDKGCDVNAKQGNGLTPLHLAALSGLDETIWALLNSGQVDNINERAAANHDRTPLHIAIIEKNESVARILIQGGADVNTHESQFGRSALHMAALKGLEQTTLDIINCGRLENVDKRDEADKRTSLHLAILNTNQSVARILIERGASFKVLDKNGQNCLHYICFHGLVELLKGIWTLVTMEDFEAGNDLKL